MQPTPVTPLPQHTVLDREFAENRVERMREMGAINVDAPLPRSAYLKNIKTGLVLPWTFGLAGMKDVMVNCDKDGNTDPAAWAATVNPVDYSPEEQAMLLQTAYRVLPRNNYEVPMPEGMKAGLNNPEHSKMPLDAQPMQEFFKARNHQVMDTLEKML